VARWQGGLAKALHGGGGPGFESHGLHKNFEQQTKTKPIKGCHVAAHDWATWHHTICQKCHVSQYDSPNCQPIKLPHHLPHQHVRSSHISMYGHATSASVRTVRTAQSASIFFTCLTIRTDRDISRSRRPFETKRVALGS
jgi:hypothetical protein